MNPVNFLALLKTFAETDKVLFSHCNSPRVKNATYISPRSQNEIKTAQYFFVLADEVCYPYAFAMFMVNVTNVKICSICEIGPSPKRIGQAH